MKIEMKRKKKLLLMVSITLLGFLILISVLVLSLKGQLDDRKKVEQEKQRAIDHKSISDLEADDFSTEVDAIDAQDDSYFYNQADANNLAHLVRYVEFNNALYVAQLSEKTGTTVYDLTTSKAIRYIENHQPLFATSEFIYFLVEDDGKRQVVREDQLGKSSVYIEELVGDLFQFDNKVLEINKTHYQGEWVLTTEKELFTLDQRGLNRYNIETQELLQSYSEINQLYFLDIQVLNQRVYILTENELFFIEDGQMQQLLSNAFFDNKHQIRKLYEKSGSLYAWVVDGSDPKNVYIAYIDQVNRQFFEVANIRLGMNELSVGAMLKDAWISVDAKQGLHVYPLLTPSQGKLKPYLQLLSETQEESTQEIQRITTYTDISTGFQMDVPEGYTKEKLASGVTRIKINPFIEISYVAYNSLNFIEKDYANAINLVDPLATTNNIYIPGASEAFESYIIKNGDYVHQMVFKAFDSTHYLTARLLAEAPEESADLLMMVLDSVALNLSAVIDDGTHEPINAGYLDLESVHLAFLDAAGANASGEVKGQMQVREMAQTLNETDGLFSWRIEVVTKKDKYTIIIDRLVMHTDQTALKALESYRTRLMKEVDGIITTSEIQSKVSVDGNNLIVSGVYLPGVTLFDVDSIVFTTELDDKELDRLLFYQRSN